MPLVPVQAPVSKSVSPTTEWDQPPEPVSSFVPETTYQVTEEVLVSEEGGHSNSWFFFLVIGGKMGGPDSGSNGFRLKPAVWIDSKHLSIFFIIFETIKCLK